MHRVMASNGSQRFRECDSPGRRFACTSRNVWIASPMRALPRGKAIAVAEGPRR